MTSFEHTNTFLRSALLKDPFSLGDIGPEDVLRIESEFPNLFASPTRKSHKARAQVPAVRSPYSIPLKAKPPSTAPSVVVPKNRYALRNGDSAQPSCSRGSRCFPHSVKLPTKNTAAFAKQYFPRTTGSAAVTNSRMHTYLSLDPVASKYPENISTLQRLLQDETAALRRKESQVSKILTKAPEKRPSKRFGDSSSVAKSDTNGVELLEIITSTGRRSNLPKQVRKVKNETQSEPRLSTAISQKGRTATAAAPTGVRAKLEVELVKSCRVEQEIPTKDSKPDLPKAKNAPGFIRPTFSLPGLRNHPKTSRKKKLSKQRARVHFSDVQKPPQAEGDAVIEQQEKGVKARFNKPITLPPDLNGIDKESEPTFVTSSSDSEELWSDMTPLWYSPIKIRSGRTAEDMSLEMAQRDLLERETTEKFEQLVFAKLLASKYEQEGKFQKSKTKQIVETIPSEVPRRLHSTPRGQSLDQATLTTSDKLNDMKRYTTFHEHDLHEVSNRTPMKSLSLKQKSILEKIAEELIRAEVLNCLHNEDLNGKMEVGLGTETEPQDYETPMNSQLQSFKLSTITEEIVPTPDLTPPKVVTRTLGRRLESAGDMILDSINTPEISPPLKVIPPLKRTLPGNKDDFTDCSSISEFVVSDIPTPKKDSRKVNLVAVLPDLKTPNSSPPASLLMTYRQQENLGDNEGDSTGPDTPAASASGSAIRFGLPGPVLRDRDSSRELSRAANSTKSKTGERKETVMEDGSNAESKDKASSIILVSKSVSSSQKVSATHTLNSQNAAKAELLSISYKSPGEVSLTSRGALSDLDELESSGFEPSEDLFTEDSYGVELSSEGEL